MKPWKAIARAALLEVLSDPLSVLVSAGAVFAVACACVFHIHQFGEPARMARDAGLSVFLVSTIAFGVFSTIKAFRREIESGTLQMALARPVSRRCFFLSKAAGCFAACLQFAGGMAATVFTAVLGAEAGGIMAAPTGDVPRIWKPALLAIALSAAVPLVAAAAANRFAKARFAATATRIAPGAAAAAAAVVAALAVSQGMPLETLSKAFATFPALVVLLLPAAVFTVAAAAFAMRFKANSAAALCGLLFLASLPALGNHYLSGALAGGGTIPFRFIAAAAAAALPFVAAFAAIGVRFADNADAA